MTNDARSQIKKYFKKFPTWAVVVIAILGLPSLLIGLSTSSSFGQFSLFWAAVWIALGVWRIVSYYKKPSDAEMDALGQPRSGICDCTAKADYKRRIAMIHGHD